MCLPLPCISSAGKHYFINIPFVLCFVYRTHIVLASYTLARFARSVCVLKPKNIHTCAVCGEKCLRFTHAKHTTRQTFNRFLLSIKKKIKKKKKMCLVSFIF